VISSATSTAHVLRGVACCRCLGWRRPPSGTASPRRP